MKVTQTIDVQCAVIARLDETGALSVKVTGHADYADGCGTSIALEPPAELQAEVGAALGQVLSWATKNVAVPMQDSIHVSRRVAMQFREI